MILQKYFDAFGNRIQPGMFFFGGGKAPSVPKQKPIKMPEAPRFEMPTAPNVQLPVQAPPPPPDPIPPSPTVSALDAQQAASDKRGQASRRNGIRQTLIAGESTGPLASASGGVKTLLG